MSTTATDRVPVRRALVSVSDKTGLVELAGALHEAGVALVSTGSTAQVIAAAGVPVTAVEELTGFPESLGGRVKTLHPRVHAGILADTADPDHLRQLAELGIEAFELVVVNLYPFEATVASGAPTAECIEQIDIGGPSMVRAAAKNSGCVAVVSSPSQYPAVLEAIAAGGTTLRHRRELAGAAFAATAAYDVAVAGYWAGTISVEEPADEPAASQKPVFPSFVGATWTLGEVLRYGENPHQGAAVYTGAGLGGGGQGADGLATAEQLHGKAMSYNNYVDADAARRAVSDFAQPAVAIIKHANPCGIAVGADIADVHARAHACDPVSAFGGVIATNRPVSLAMAEQVAEVFTEVVVAPGYEPGALELLARKKNVRLLRVPVAAATTNGPRWEFRGISGGLLVQEADLLQAEGDIPDRWTLAAGEPADAETLADLAFAWRAVRAVRSNAILLASALATVGVGMGQVNRVDSCRLAVSRAGADRARGAVAASDAFFPFADGLQVLLDAGVRAVVQPGGSMRDGESIDAARDAGVTMYLTGARHFLH